MQVQRRSFDDLLQHFRDEFSRPVRQFSPHSSKVERSYSFQDLTDLDQGEATYSLHRLKKSPLEDDPQVLSHPQALVEYFKAFPEVGIWNASGEATWQGGDDWMVVKAKLVHEADVHAQTIVFVTLGIRQVSDGWAALIWGPGHQTFAAIFGFDHWPDEGWDFAMVDHGD